MRAQARCNFIQRGFVLGGKSEYVTVEHDCGRCRTAGGWPLLNQDMRIRAHEAKRADGSTTRSAVARPRTRFSVDEYRQLIPRDAIGGLIAMQVSRNQVMIQRENDFDQSRDAGGRFEMPDIGLHGTDAQ